MKIHPDKNAPQPEELTKLPRVGITIGDAAGIGPEITLKALADQEIKKICQPIIIGDAGVIRNTARLLNLDFNFLLLNKNQQLPETDKIIVCDLSNLGDGFALGADQDQTGKAAAENILAAVELWREGKIDAVSTAPISKKAIQMGGYDFPGHTEFLAELTNTEKFAMSFFADKLRVVLLSTHVSLIDAIDLVKKEKLIDLIVFTDQTLSKLLNKKVKIAIAGLNPHASESGMFGDEERREIVPAIEMAREKFDVDVSGAYSPDTIFLRAFRGEFDAVVACYHDQATIAVKCLSFGASVNVTLGLPLVRTSVDHGTAFDIAGKNLADASSMQAAIRLAAKLSGKQHRQRNFSQNLIE